MSDYSLFAAGSGDEIQGQQVKSVHPAEPDHIAEDEPQVDPLFGTNSGDEL